MASDDAPADGTSPDAEATQTGLRARLRNRRRWQERNRQERGVVVIWVTLMLVALIGMCGFAVDLSNWWLQSERLQRAADAGAHAGVVFLPADLQGATSTARAETAKNGYRATGADQNATVTVAQEPNPNRLRVKVTAEVPTYFVRVFGINSIDLTREAVAEYVAPVPMGSPENKVGNDPENGYISPQFWLNVAGPNGNKQSGDRYQSKNCTASVASCTSSVNAGIQNDDYAYDGYAFGLKVENVVAGQPLLVRAYDPAFTYVNDYCQTNMPTQAQANALQALPGNPYPDAGVRYAPTPSVDGRYVPTAWCTGDQDIGGRTTRTTFVLRSPDTTPWDSFDNPIVCSVTMPAFTPGQNGQASIYDMLHPTSGPNDGQHVINPNDGVLTFAELFRRNVTLCQVPAGSVEVGDYILQIRSNSQPGSPDVYSTAMNQGGHNRFSIQAGFGLSGATSLDGTDVSINALGRLPIYNNATGADTNFYLARVLPYDAGRTLRISLFDISDVGQSGTMQIVPPEEFGTSFSGCGFSNDTNKTMTYNASTCTLTVPNSFYNERNVTVDVPIPENYNCDEDDPLGCWIKVRAQFGGPTSDTTTWSAAILGNPIRLVE